MTTPNPERTGGCAWLWALMMFAGIVFIFYSVEQRLQAIERGDHLKDAK